MQLDLFSPRAETVFVRHRWARLYILRVLDNGTVRVTLPKWGSKKEAAAFVERSGAWITRQLLKQNSRANNPANNAANNPAEAGCSTALRTRASKELPG